MSQKKTKKKRRQTIGIMSQSRGYMPPPTRADITKKGKGSYKRNKEKRVNYETY